MMDGLKAKIFSIARVRDVDGPGIRTLVGFCGCPLRCAYCLNHEALSSGVGEWYTPEKLLEEVRKDDIYFQSTGGGVTFSGGEPALQSEFIVRFRDICPPEWNLALETSLNVPRKHIEALRDAVNYWYIDIKDINPEIYERYTGCPITRVRENLEYLSHNRDRAVIQVRVPLIEGYNTEKDRTRTLTELSAVPVMTELFDYTSTTPRRFREYPQVLMGALACERDDPRTDNPQMPDEHTMAMIEELRGLGKNVNLDEYDWD